MVALRRPPRRRCSPTTTARPRASPIACSRCSPRPARPPPSSSCSPACGRTSDCSARCWPRATRSACTGRTIVRLTTLPADGHARPLPRRARPSSRISRRIPVRWSRPPYGAQDPASWRAARDVGLEPVLWSVACHDWETHPPEEYLAELRATDPAGSVVLLHDGFADERDGVDDGPPADPRPDRPHPRCPRRGCRMPASPATASARPSRTPNPRCPLARGARRSCLRLWSEPITACYVDVAAFRAEAAIRLDTARGREALIGLQFDEAIAALERGTNPDTWTDLPDTSAVPYRTLLEQAVDYAKALEQRETARGQTAHHTSEIVLANGRGLEDAREYKAAVENYRTALTLYPQDVRLRAALQRADVLRRIKAAMEAEDTLVRGVQALGGIRSPAARPSGTGGRSHLGEHRATQRRARDHRSAGEGLGDPIERGSAPARDAIRRGCGAKTAADCGGGAGGTRGPVSEGDRDADASLRGGGQRLTPADHRAGDRTDACHTLRRDGGRGLGDRLQVGAMRRLGRGGGGALRRRGAPEVGDHGDPSGTGAPAARRGYSELLDGRSGRGVAGPARRGTAYAVAH